MVDPAEIRSWIERTGTYSFTRSSGPGGQNVNKVSTRVTLSLPLAHGGPLTPEELGRVATVLRRRLSADGEFVINVSTTRSQATNRELAIERALHLIVGAAVPKKKRRPTRPGKAARERRIQDKKQRGEKKRRRRGDIPE